MKEDILSAVVKVEKELAETLREEKRKSKDMLDRLRNEREHKVTREKKRLQCELNRSITDAKMRSQKKVSAMIADAYADAERLEKISDDTLKKIIRKYIVRILP
jgi:hypothetical protein